MGLLVPTGGAARPAGAPPLQAARHPRRGMRAGRAGSPVCAAAREGELLGLLTQRAAAAGAQKGREGAGGQEEEAAGVEVAVFRFTLGIPGFDDALIPRAVGAGGALLLLLNRALEGGQPPVAQVWGEALAALLVAVCALTPTLEQRLKQSLPGRGLRAPPSRPAPADTRELFQLAGGLAEAARTELAWASFALLRNTPSCSVLVASAGSGVLLLRGSWRGGATADTAAPAGPLGQACQGLLAGSQAQELEGARSAGYWPTRPLQSSELAPLAPYLPQSSECVLVQRLPVAAGEVPALILLASTQPRAFPMRDRQWVNALAQKLQAVLRA